MKAGCFLGRVTRASSGASRPPVPEMVSVPGNRMLCLPQCTESQAGRLSEVTSVTAHDRESVLKGSRSYQGVRKTQASVVSQSSGALCDVSVYRKLAKGCEQLRDRFCRRRSREQLGAGHHGVVQPVRARPKLCSSAQVIDEDVGVDEQISHVPTRRVKVP